MSSRSSPTPRADAPGIYRIRVAGSLGRGSTRRLEGLSITEEPTPDGHVETILVGRMLDQAELAGVLNALFELRAPLASVECPTQD